MPKQKILICDDSEGVRESLKLILEDCYEIEFACDGCQALEIIKTSPPDLVILDIKMPKVDGITALKEIRSLNPKTKILFVTGYQYNDVAQNAVDLGAEAYIIKPFEQKELITAVKNILNRK